MIYIFLALILYTIAILIGTLASRNLNSILLSGIVNSVSAILPLILAFPLLSKKTFVDFKFGVALAVCAGIVIALFTLALNKSFSLNKVAVVTPIVFGGAILLTSIFGSIIFKEKLSSIEIIGLAVLAVGLGIIIYAKVTAG